MMRELLMPWVRMSYADLDRACADADLIVTHPLAFAGRLIAEKRGLPWVSTVLAPLSLMSAIDPERNLVRRIGIIGVALDSATTNAVPGLRSSSGVLVVALAGYGGSVESGLMPGDVIHTVNRKRVTSLDELRSALRELKVGSAAVLQIERQGVFKFLQFEIE